MLYVYRTINKRSIMFIFVSNCADYPNSYSNITPRANGYYTTCEYSAVDFVCNNTAYNLSDCYFNVASDYVCQSHEYDAYLTCTVGENCKNYCFVTVMPKGHFALSEISSCSCSILWPEFNFVSVLILTEETTMAKHMGLVQSRSHVSRTVGQLFE